MSFKDLEDAAVALTNSVFGTSVTYTPQSGSPVNILGVFDNLWVMDIQGIQSVRPTLKIRLLDLPAKPGKGDSVTISSVNYKVLMSHEESHGGAVLILQKVP